MKSIIRPTIKSIQHNMAYKIFRQLLLVILVSSVFAAITPNFRSISNVVQITLSAACYVILAMGLSCVLISGATDLSAGSIVCLSGMSCCILVRDYNASLEMGILAGLLTGILCGLLNGLLVTKLELVPFIATLGTQWIYRGLANIVSEGRPVSIRDVADPLMAERFYFIGGGRIGILPTPVWIFIVVGLVLSFLFTKTVYGRDLFAVGSSSEAARLSGINVLRTKIIAFMLCGGLSALAGIMLAARLTSAQTNAGDGYEFEGIFASVIGGVSMAGGEGTIFGAMCGAFFVAILRNGLNLNGISTFWQKVVMGAIIIVAVYIDTRRVHMKRNV